MGVRVVSLMAVVSLLIACGDSHESAYDDQVDLLEDLIELLEGVDDADSADDAAEEVEGHFRDETLSIQVTAVTGAVKDDIDYITTTAPTIGGEDTITTGTGNDFILAGTAGDTIFERLEEHFGSDQIVTAFIGGKINNIGARGPHEICVNCWKRYPDTREKTFWWEESTSAPQFLHVFEILRFSVFREFETESR